MLRIFHIDRRLILFRLFIISTMLKYIWMPWIKFDFILSSLSADYFSSSPLFHCIPTIIAVKGFFSSLEKFMWKFYMPKNVVSLCLGCYRAPLHRRCGVFRLKSSLTACKLIFLYNRKWLSVPNATLHPQIDFTPFAWLYLFDQKYYSIELIIKVSLLVMSVPVCFCGSLP